ncbi:MAG: plasmid recombination protein [Lachnospiraceae bacterium]|nr:plasmid recombination protein [Lachnospiraceae bacterium]
MPDLKTISLQQAIHCSQEAVRTLSGYSPEDSNIKRHALLNKEKSADNVTLFLRDCVNIQPGTKNQTKALEQYYRDRFHKSAKKNTCACSLFFGLPKDYLPADFHLTGPEYKALCMEAANQPGVDREALERAHKKILSRDFTDAEKDAIRDFFEKAIPVLCRILGIKEDDILYAIVHMDESFPHLHFSFLPAAYVQDQVAWQAYQAQPAKGKRPRSLRGDINRTIAPSENPIGCSVERFNRPFLLRLNQNLEKGFQEQGIQVHIANSKGQINDVQKTAKPQREAAAIARGLEEESKRRRKEMDAEFDTEYSKRKVILNQLNVEIRDSKAERDELQNEVASLTTRQNTLQSKIAKSESRLEQIKDSIKDAQKELSDLQERIHFWVAAGIRKIKKALSRKDKDEAANEAMAALLQIQTDAVITLPHLDDAEDEYDVYESESEQPDKDELE